MMTHNRQQQMIELLEAELDRAVAQKMDARLRAELDTLRPIWEGAPKYGIGALIEAFRLCANRCVPLPPKLARAVHAELIRHAPKQVLKDYERWSVQGTMSAVELGDAGQEGRMNKVPSVLALAVMTSTASAVNTSKCSASLIRNTSSRERFRADAQMQAA